MGLLDMMSMLGGVDASMGQSFNPGVMQQMRAMRYLRSMGGGQAHTPRQQGNPMGGMGSEPDYSAYTYDPAARAQAAKALSPYGLSPLAPEDVKQNALLPNTGFFGNHPRLSSAIEGGIFGGASTQGSNTWGEGISNVFQGLIHGQQARRGMLNQQFEAPFKQAQGLEGLYDLQQKREDQAAMIKYHQGMLEHQGDKPDPMPHALGREVPSYLQWNDKDRKYDNVPNPNYDPKAERRAGQTENERIFEGMRGAPPETGTPGKKKGMDTRQEYYQNMGNWIQGREESTAAGKRHATNQADLNDDVRQTQTDKNNRQYNDKMAGFIKSQKRSFWAGKQIRPDDVESQKAWYQKNFPSGAGGSFDQPGEYTFVPGKGLQPNSH